MLFKLSLFCNNRNVSRSKRGFGLIELMVSVSIMTLVSSIILVKNRSFNNALLLRNQAYEVALALRQVQLQAVSGNRVAGATTDQYGIYFNLSSATTNHRYQAFRDSDSGTAGWYEGSDTVIGVLESIDQRFQIVVSNSSGVATGDNYLSITFVRPNFDALFKTGASAPESGPQYLKIMPKDTSGYSDAPYRLVEITSTGQISVK